MCGLAGLLYADDRPVDPALLDRMTDTLAHRGPDSRGIWHAPGIGLGHRRLAIRDLSPCGAQPMASADGRVMVAYNGEIYNDKPLKAELARQYGFISHSSGDTEILPAGWQAWGLDLFRRLEGIFAIALWDRQNQQLVLARDAVGTKPLYYSLSQGVLRFGSEIKALLADPDQSARLAPAELRHFLALGYPPPDASLIDGIRQVPPATALVFDRTGLKQTHRFWAPTRTGRLRNQNEALATFIPLFKQVVADQLVSDVPSGILQSGGIDSTLITLALPADASTPLYCATFSEKSHDESAEALQVATKAGRPLSLIAVDKNRQNAPEIFRHLVDVSDGQLADSSAFSAYQVCQAIGQTARVALSGDGGDEFFAGYPTYRASQLASWLAPLLPRALWSQAGYILRQLSGVSERRVPLSEKIFRFLLGMGHAHPASAWRRYLYPADEPALLSPSLIDSIKDPLAGYALAGCEGKTPVDQALLADQAYYLPADMLMKSDRMSMAHALELRVPLLDRRIMDFAASLHPSLLMAQGRNKYILRETARQLGAPPEITDRRKTGFNLPINRLLATSLHPLANRWLHDNPDFFAPLIKPDGVRNLWHQHNQGQINHSYVLWTLLVLAQWRDITGSRLVL